MRTRAWETIEGRAYEGARNTSGATDANILRQRGIPTTRMGMPKLRDTDGSEVDFSMGMNSVDPATMASLTRALVRTIVDTCTRTAPKSDCRAERRAVITITERLAELGIDLPPPIPGPPDHAALVQTGTLVFVSGHGPLDAQPPAGLQGPARCGADRGDGRTPQPA